MTGDPSTVEVGKDAVGIGGATDVNGATYAFNDLTNQIETLNLLTGAAIPVGHFDPAAGVIQGAAPTPEPASLAPAIAGAVIILISKTAKSKRAAISRVER